MVVAQAMLQTIAAAGPGAAPAGADPRPMAAAEFKQLVEAMLAQCPAQRGEKPVDPAAEGTVLVAQFALLEGPAAEAQTLTEGTAGVETQPDVEGSEEDTDAPRAESAEGLAAGAALGIVPQAAVTAAPVAAGTQAEGKQGDGDNTASAAVQGVSSAGAVQGPQNAGQVSGAQSAAPVQNAQGAQDTGAAEAMQNPGAEQAGKTVETVAAAQDAETSSGEDIAPWDEAANAILAEEPPAAAGVRQPVVAAKDAAELPLAAENGQPEANAQGSDAKTAPQAETGASSAGERLMHAIRQAVSAGDAQEKKNAADTGSGDGETAPSARAEQNSAAAAVPAALESAPATEAAEPAAPGRTQDAPQSIYRLVEGIAQSEAGGAKEFEVSLKPEFMGEMSIKLVAEEDGLKAIIKVAQRPASELIASELTSLKELLRDRGINIARLEVAYQPPMTTGGADRQAMGRQGSGAWGSRKGHYKAMPDAVELGAALDPAAEHRIRLNGSVEFSA